jgi:anti-anti-sigma factor
MAFEINMVVTGAVAEITLAGELDRGSADRLFQPELDRLFQFWKGEPPEEPMRVVLRMRDLVFMASAGIRMLIYAKQQARQQLGSVLTIYVIAPQERPLNTLRETGVDRDVVVLDEYPPTTK